MNMIKKIAFTMAAILVIATLTACGASSNVPEPVATEIQEETAESVLTEVVEPENTDVVETETIEVVEVVETEAIPEVKGPAAGSLSYAEYLELSVEDQQAYYENFESADKFFEWMDNAKTEYEASTEPVETFAPSSDGQESTGPVEVLDGIFVEEGVEDWE